MKYLVSLFCTLMGIIGFTSYSYSDSSANNNSTASDYILQGSIEAKEFDRTTNYKDQYIGIDDSFKSTNDAEIADDFGDWNTTDQGFRGNFNIGNIDKSTNLKNSVYKTTLEAHLGISPNNGIVIDTGSKVNVIFLNPIQQH